MKRILMTAALLAIATTAVLAETAAPTVTRTTTLVDYGQAFGWLQPYVISTVGMLITAAGGWLVFLVNKWLGIKIDKDQAEVYQRAAKNYAASLIADGFVKIKENGKVEVSNANVAAAANDMLAAVPGAAAHFGISVEEAGKKIVDMIPQVPAVTGAAAPVVINNAA